MKSKTKVAVVIPAYNEETTIEQVVSGLDVKLKKTKFDYKIIVVDDGSSDNTVARVPESKALIIKHILNTGSGGATSTGLSYAEQNNFDMAATMDADGQHNADDLIRGLREMQKQDVDLLIGSRLINPEGMSKTKVVGNKGLSAITYMMFGVNVTDSQSGLRIFSRNALENLKWKTSGYEFCSEMLWRAKQQGMRIKEYPIQAIYTEYSVSKGQNNWNAFNILKSLLRRRVVEFFGE